MSFRKLQHHISALYADPKNSVNDYLKYAAELSTFSLDAPDYFRTLRAAFLGSYTLHGLPDVFTAKAIFHNILATTYEAPYNQYTQELLDQTSGLHVFKPDIVYVMIDAADVVDKEHLGSLVEAVCTRTKGAVVIANFTISKGATPQHVTLLNTHLLSLKEHYSNLSIFDFDAFLSVIGKDLFWYTKYTSLGDLRLAPQAFPVLAEQLLSYGIAHLGATKKCIVLDLDNTLWDGVVGEDGIDGIVPNKNLQRQLKKLKDQGILLAINSKNNPDDGLAVFEEHPDMLLRADDFSALRINWNDKAHNIKELAEELKLGLDSFLFLDDSPFERSFVKEAFPEVAVLPPELLATYSGFAMRGITAEDKNRTDLYAAERRRTESQSSFTTVEAFLKSLNLKAAIRVITPETLKRASQLTQKTNQFNLTTRRYTEEDLTRLFREGWRIWTIEVEDRFGKYGIVGVCIVEPLQNTWRIDTFLLSCRVLGRGVERAFFAYILECGNKEGIETIYGEFIPTSKNKPSESFFTDMQFTFKGKDGICSIYERNMHTMYVPHHFIKIIS